jgi:hypothetical protein
MPNLRVTRPFNLLTTGRLTVLPPGREWDSLEIRDAWAAGLWVRLFDAKQEAAQGGGPQLDRLASDIDERLDRAALN